MEAALLRSTIDAPDSLAAQLEDETLGLLRAVSCACCPTTASRLVLVIDQFEELFTLVEDETERRRFLANLVAALDDPHGRMVVILTLRADSYHRPLGYAEFAARLASNVVNVLPLTSDELESAAQEPAARTGVSLEPALLAELLADVIGEPGALPIFQYALTELFDRRDGDVLTVAAYRAMGGVRGALSRRADDLYHRLTLEEQEAATAAVPAAGDDHRARRLGATAGAGIGDRLVGRRRGHDGVGHRPTRPASVPGVRP